MFTEEVYPLRYTENGIVIVQRATIKSKLIEIASKLQNDVAHSENEQNIEENVIYAAKVAEKPWRRANLKFVRQTDGVAVLQLLDENGLLDMGSETLVVRKIQSKEIQEMPSGIIKMFIYGLSNYITNHEFKLVFNILLQKKISAIFSLISNKENAIHEAYAGDLFYDYKGKWFSFRELLIREELASPAMKDSTINGVIFNEVAGFLQLKNGKQLIQFGTLISDIAVMPEAELNTIQNTCAEASGTGTLTATKNPLVDLFAKRNDDIRLMHIIGEGTVCFFI